MAETISILNPAGHVRVEEVSLAQRPRALDGLRPGILENKKANARLLMETMVEGMRARLPLGALTIGSKPVAAGPSPATVDLLRNGSDFILVGSSD